LHQAYIESGADVVLTCTFGGNRYRLESHNLAGRVQVVNQRAAELAREAAATVNDQAGDTRVFVAGDIGPTGQLLQPFGLLTPEEMSTAFAEQARALAQGGVDFLLLETMSDLGEALAAIEGARSATDLPIICSFSFDHHGRTMMGLKPATVAEKLGPLVEGIGANCGQDPAETVGFITAMRQAAPDTIIWAKPNAGLPHLVDDQVVYDASPQQMAEIAVRIQGAGAQVVGGCCGTTPAHLAAMAAALKHSPGNTSRRQPEET
jgi:5-methyltetrahydrofolate--homocysteine methyltransferase